MKSPPLCSPSQDLFLFYRLSSTWSPEPERPPHALTGSLSTETTQCLSFKVAYVLLLSGSLRYVLIATDIWEVVNQSTGEQTATPCAKRFYIFFLEKSKLYIDKTNTDQGDELQARTAPNCTRP